MMLPLALPQSIAYLQIAEVAALCGLQERTARRRASAWPCLQVGAWVRVEAHAIDARFEAPAVRGPMGSVALARWWRCSPQHVRDMVRTAGLPMVPRDGALLIEPGPLLAWVRAHTTRPAGGLSGPPPRPELLRRPAVGCEADRCCAAAPFRARYRRGRVDEVVDVCERHLRDLHDLGVLLRFDGPPIALETS